MAKIKSGSPPPRFIVDIEIHAVEGRSRTLFVDEVGCICVREGPENVIPTVDEVIIEGLKDMNLL